MKLKQNVIIEPSNNITGRFAGLTSTGRAIILLDRPTNTHVAIEVRAEDVKPLNCYWCLDKKQVPATGFTMVEYTTNSIPLVKCPYCI